MQKERKKRNKVEQKHVIWGNQRLDRERDGYVIKSVTENVTENVTSVLEWWTPHAVPLSLLNYWQGTLEKNCRARSIARKGCR